MSGAISRIRNGLVFVHRWLGVGFCALFAMWFVSGFVMMYWRYPRIDPADRLARAGALESAKIHVAPEQAVTLIPPPSRVVITMLDGRPVYRIHSGSRQRIVFADNGDPLAAVSEHMARRIAASWTGRPLGGTKFEGSIRQADQWTVGGIFRAHGALLKYAWPDGQEVYVSPVTAEVVQHTTRGSRMGAYFGAIPHWLYFAPLRRNAPLWSRIVIWSSGVGAIVALLGIVVGIWRYLQFKRIPYTGQKRWHAILGLVFGLFTCTWVFSGMMSMDPFPALQPSGGGVSLRAAPVPITTFAALHPRDALARVAELKVKELELLSVDGEPSYLATEGPNVSRIVPLHGAPAAAFEQARLVDFLARASRPYELAEVRVVTEYETYYVDRQNRLPLPALFVAVNDPGRSMYYIDPRTARVAESYSNMSSRWNRWLFQGLHSIDLPWLYRAVRLGISRY